jgi:mannose-6-phosphate isomerase-like protein (cupin superfamily)
MPIANMFEGEWVEVEAPRGGKGVVRNRKLLGEEDLQTPVMGVSYGIVPPSAAIGLHEHPTEQDFYVILEGQGRAVVDGEERQVGPGDVFVNSLGGNHALENTGDTDLVMLAWCVRATQ